MEMQKRQPDDRRKYADARTAYRALCELLSVLGPLKWVFAIVVSLWTAFIIVPNPFNKFTRFEESAVVRDQRLERVELRLDVVDGFVAAQCLDSMQVTKLVKAQVPCYRLLRERGLMAP